MKLSHILLLSCITFLFRSTELLAQDYCSAITSKGIFDVRSKREQKDMVNDVIHWLSVNEFSTEQDAKNAALQIGIVIPDVNIPVNADGTYGESHSKSWSRAAAEFLASHSEFHERFEQTFVTANPDIVNAWKECVVNAKGLICWAKQTDNPQEVILNLELRPKSTSFWTLWIRVEGIQASENVEPKAKKIKQWLGFGTETPYLYSRKKGDTFGNAANFIVETSDRDYRCQAAAPSLPVLASSIPQPIKAPHHNHPRINFLVAFDNKIGAEPYGNGQWTKMQGIETIRIDFSSAFDDIRFRYTCHVEGFGDQPWFESGQTCGFQERKVHIEGFRVELAGRSAPFYDVIYECQAAGEANPRTAHNGEFCGTQGELKQLQRAKITVVAKEQFMEPE